jgi:hypothetical protein
MQPLSGTFAFSQDHATTPTATTATSSPGTFDSSISPIRFIGAGAGGEIKRSSREVKLGFDPIVGGNKGFNMISPNQYPANKITKIHP